MTTPELMRVSLRVAVARSVSDLVQHSEKWNALAAEAPQQLPMLSYAWLAPYFDKVLQNNERWACLFAYRDSQLVGVLPLVLRSQKRGGVSFAFLQTPRDDHTQIGDLLLTSTESLDPAAAQNVVATLIAAARKEFPQAAYVEINRFAQTSRLLDVLRAPRSGSSPGSSLCWEDSYGAYLPIPADYLEFRAGLSKNFKSNLNKAANKTAQLSDVRYRFEHAAAADVADLSLLLEVEGSGWKGAAGSAIAKSPLWIAFYTDLVANMKAAGWLEWQFMHGDGRVLAANMCMRMPKSVILWKLGYNDAYARCSPGNLLMEELLKQEAVSRGLSEINMTTDLPWYDNWKMVRRTYYTARFYFGLRGLVAWYLPDRLRDKLRRSPWAVNAKRWVSERLRGRSTDRETAGGDKKPDATT